MRIDFPYGNIPPVHVSDGNLIGYYHPKRVPDALPPEDIVRQALANPIQAVPLVDAVRSKKRVTILVDDITRPSPQDLLLPPILSELQRAGVRDGEITILVAGGTHRAVLPLEKERKLGMAVVHRYRVLDHDWQGHELVDLGKLPDGTPVEVNRHVVEADFVLGVGHIVPHRVLGYSGGAKIALPGIAGKSSIDHMHWAAAQFPGKDILGHVDNPIRRMVNAFGKRVGLGYIVNIVQDDEGRVVGAWAGDPIAAHQKGCEVSREIYGIPIPEPADIAITDSYPSDLDLWQSIKAVFAADLAVRDGGVIVLVTPSPEGASMAHPRLAQIGYHPVHEVERMVQEGKIEAGTAAAALAYGGRIIKERVTGIIVSPGIPDHDKRQLGFQPAATPQDALQQAFALVGDSARVAIFHHGGEMLPIITGH